MRRTRTTTTASEKLNVLAGGRRARAPFAARGGVELERSPLEPFEQGLPVVLARVGIPGASIEDVRADPLSFLMEGDGRRWLVSYDLQAGSVSGRPANEASAAGERSTRWFLTRLHMTHGYPSEFNARWVWAVLVDVMSTLMIFWGVSGLVM